MSDRRSSALRACALGAVTLVAACTSNNNGTTGTSGGTTNGASASATTTGGSGTGAATTGSGTGGGPTGTGTATTGGSSTGAGGLGATVIANAGFTSPFDAVLDGTGAKAYFTALASGSPTVFSALANGSAAGTPTDLAVTGLNAPLGLAISTDNNTLYSADLGFEDPGTGALGQLVSFPASGGAATAVAGTLGYAPIGVTVSNAGGSDAIFFTGTDPANGKPGLFKSAGGSTTVVAEGAPFASPSGVVVDTNGNAYVVDQGAVISVIGGTAAVLKSGLSTGFPGGIALSADGTALYIASTDPTTGNDALAVVDLTGSGAPTYQLGAAGGAFSGFTDPGGLHGIGSSSVFVDGTASGTGRVYVVK